MFTKNRRIFTIFASLVMVVALMMSMTACDLNFLKKPSGTEGGDSTSTPSVTVAPGGDYVMEISGPDTLVKGETVEYTLKITECNTPEGLIGLDFSFEYNNELLKYEDTKNVKLPADTWEVISRDDNEYTRTYFCVDDNDNMDELVAVTGANQFEVVLEFKVVGDTSENKDLIKLFDVTGAINDADINTAYGTGNSISLK